MSLMLCPVRPEKHPFIPHSAKVRLKVRACRSRYNAVAANGRLQSGSAAVPVRIHYSTMCQTLDLNAHDCAFAAFVLRISYVSRAALC